MKICEVCRKQIPEDFVNALCMDCYVKAEGSRETSDVPAPTVTVESILEENQPVQQNMSANVSWVERGLKRYMDIGTVIPKMQYKLYKSLAKHWVSGKTVIDVGCSLGVGSNILSHTARHVWGIDMVEDNIKFAKNVFERPNLTFEQYDIEYPNTSRELSKFEVVVFVEVLEHLSDPILGLRNLKNKFFNTTWLDQGGNSYIKERSTPKGGNPTVGFITVPNTNNPHVKAADAKNKLHLTHYTPSSFYTLLTEHFRSVVLYDGENVSDWSQDETVNLDTQCRLLIAKVEDPIVNH